MIIEKTKYNSLTHQWTLHLTIPTSQVRPAYYYNSGVTVVIVTNHFLVASEAHSTGNSFLALCAWSKTHSYRGLGPSKEPTFVLLNRHIVKQPLIYVYTRRPMLLSALIG